MTVEAPEAPVPDVTAPPAAPPPATDATDWKAEAERWKARARQNEDRSKANHSELTQRDEVLRAIAEKVGVPFDGKPDALALTRKLEQAQAAARTHSVELAVYHNAAGAGADASALLDSREFMNRAGALDPDAVDFAERVAEIVAEAAKQPRYQSSRPAGDGQAPAATATQAAPPAPASGADFSGAPGGHRLWTQADYDRAIATDKDGSVITKAIADGLLVNLGIGKPRSRHRR